MFRVEGLGFREGVVQGSRFMRSRVRVLEIQGLDFGNTAKPN